MRFFASAINSCFSVNICVCMFILRLCWLSLTTSFLSSYHLLFLCLVAQFDILWLSLVAFHLHTSRLFRCLLSSSSSSFCFNHSSLHLSFSSSIFHSATFEGWSSSSSSHRPFSSYCRPNTHLHSSRSLVSKIIFKIFHFVFILFNIHLFFVALITSALLNHG